MIHTTPSSAPGNKVTVSDRYFSSTEYQNFNSKAIILSKVESKEAIEATSSLKKVIITYLKVKLWRWFKPGELDGDMIGLVMRRDANM